ncbi:MAG: fibrobacter succinogenes major paralogous domain-containing protein [Bacteroidetes bacterium]|nr:fibrobacter succinogenes major paralogous domain-containing protein [Bacteroidota bacterium]
MKTFLFTISFLLITLSVFGQTKMVIHKTDGQKDTLATTGIEKITFIVAETVTDFDGNIYHTVQIGNQLWTVENLRVTKYNDGTDIPKVIDNGAWAALTTDAYCAYNNDENNVPTYGYLYNWYAVNPLLLAPAGWRVPTEADWTILGDFVGGESTAGTKLKSTTGWLNNGNGTDDYGFSAPSGGFRLNSNGAFSGMGYNADWWSSIGYGSAFAYRWGLSYDEIRVIRDFISKRYGFSVRLVRDL